MKKQASQPFRTLSQLLAALSLTLVLTPLPVDTVQAQQSATGHEGSGASGLDETVKARESRYYSVAALAY
jgi:hypothetical protein